MGSLVYGSALEYEFEDRVLAHLKIAIVTKLRLQESFLLNWVLPVERGSGRMSIWISPSIPLQFRFSGSRPPELNKVWLQALAHSAHSSRGMILMSEDDAIAYLEDAIAP